MKIYINKYLKEIHWTAYVAALLCFYTSFSAFNDYKETKYLFEEGEIEKAIVTKLPSNCYSSGRITNYVDLNIIINSRNVSLQINKKMCDTINLNDTIELRCTNKFKKVLKYDESITKTPKKDLYFSIFSLCLGLVFLIFGNEKNKYTF